LRYVRNMGVVADGNQKIWHPVGFDRRWNDVKTTKFDNLRPAWDRKRAELSKNPELYERFLDRIKRKQAVDTGIIERMYDLKRGVTETLIEEGFADSYLQHGDSNIDPGLLMHYLTDNFEALNYVFGFVKDDIELSVFYIRGLHELITRHQETTEAVDILGRMGQTPLLKGAFKELPNNPVRNGVVYEYCPPEHVQTEMDNLIRIFHEELRNTHPLIKSAFLHHAFVQIHPFQDGNGRLARLLASFVLIKDNLFPFSLDRDERTAYIDALEMADAGKYQGLVDIFSGNQIKSIEQALNLETIAKTGFDSVLDRLSKKVVSKDNAIAEANGRILDNMHSIFAAMQKDVGHYGGNIKAKLETVNIHVDFSTKDEGHYFSSQIAHYAKRHEYYFNSSLPRCWVRMRMYFNDAHHYQLVLSLHHYGYDNSALAIGAFIEKDGKQGVATHGNELPTPLDVPPLVFSSETGVDRLSESILQQIDTVITSALAYITEELM